MAHLLVAALALASPAPAPPLPNAHLVYRVHREAEGVAMPPDLQQPLEAWVDGRRLHVRAPALGGGVIDQWFELDGGTRVERGPDGVARRSAVRWEKETFAGAFVAGGAPDGARVVAGRACQVRRARFVRRTLDTDQPGTRRTCVWRGLPLWLEVTLARAEGPNGELPSTHQTYEATRVELGAANARDLSPP